MSQARNPGPRIVLRGWLPNVPGAGMEKAAGLNHIAELVKELTVALESPTRL